MIAHPGVKGFQNLIFLVRMKCPYFSKHPQMAQKQLEARMTKDRQKEREDLNYQLSRLRIATAGSQPQMVLQAVHYLWAMAHH